MQFLKFFAALVLMAALLFGCGQYRYGNTKLNCAGNGGIVVGTVTDSATGEPLNYVEVRLERIDGLSPYPNTDRTSLEGEYQVCNVPPGIYAMHLEHRDYRPLSIDSIRIERESTVVIDHSLSRLPTNVLRNIMVWHCPLDYWLRPPQLNELPVSTVEDIIRVTAGVQVR